jgi:hypothetical protein
MLSIRAKRIALVFVGVVAVAACGGSSTSTPDSPTTLFQKNGSLIGALKNYIGVGTSSEYEWDKTKDYSKAGFRTGDKFSYSFNMNMGAIDANALAPSSKLNTYSYNCMVDGVLVEKGCSNSYSTFSSETDFRSAFSNFQLTSLDGNAGTVDLAKIKWAKCPLKVDLWAEYPARNVTTPTSKIRSINVTFAEAPNDSVADDKCNPIPATTPNVGTGSITTGSSVPQNFYTATGVAVEATGAIFTVMFYRQWANGGQTLVTLPDNARPVLKDVFPVGFDGFDSDTTLGKYSNFQDSEMTTTSYTNNGVVTKYSYHQSHSLDMKSLSSKVVKDYSPFALVATADAAGVTAQWSRSADLSPDDMASHVVELSKDNFATVSETALISQEANMTTFLPSCEIDPNNTMKVGAELSLRVKALDADGISSVYTDTAVVTKALDNLVCPTATLSAPTEVQANLDIPTRQYTVQWSAAADAGDLGLTYCIETSNDSFETKNEDNKFCVGDATQSTLNWNGQDSLAFRVVAVSANGVVSQPSETAVVKLPDPQPVSNVVATQVQDGLQLSWNAAQQAGGLSNASHLVKWGLLTGEKREPESGGFALGDVSSHMVPRADWEKIALPGSKIWVDVSSCTEAACAKPVSATFAFPQAEVKDLPTDITIETSTSVTSVLSPPVLPSIDAYNPGGQFSVRETMMINPMYVVYRFCKTGTTSSADCTAWTSPQSR